jgi:uncharacterized protein
MKVLADTGFFVGLFDPSDAAHGRCRAFLAQFRGQIVTAWAVFTEACHLLDIRSQKALFHWAAAAQAQRLLIIESPSPEALGALWLLMDKYDDLPMDFCDATLVHLAIEHRIDSIATVDDTDFNVYRLPGKKRFKRVLAG